MTHDEAADAEYLRRAIEGGEAHVIMDMVRELDLIVELMGLEQSEDRAIDVLRAHPDWRQGEVTSAVARCTDCGQSLPLLYPCFQQGCPSCASTLSSTERQYDQGMSPIDDAEFGMKP